MKRLTLILTILLLVSAKAEAARYISLAPSTTEILFSLGLDKEIVGVSTFCNYPPEAKKKPKVGDFSRPSIEKILSLKPDYIFCTGLEQAQVITDLRELELNVYVADPTNITELFRTIDEIGQLTNRSKEAGELIKQMRAEIGEIKIQVGLIPQEKRIKVFFEIWHEPLMTAGKGSFVDELITTAGGINIAHDVPRPYCNFSAEKVVSLNPDCIIMAYMDKEAPLKLVAGRFGWENIAAVKTGRIYNDIDPDTLLRPGPRITEGVKELYKRFYQQ